MDSALIVRPVISTDPHFKVLTCPTTKKQHTWPQLTSIKHEGSLVKLPGGELRTLGDFSNWTNYIQFDEALSQPFLVNVPALFFLFCVCYPNPIYLFANDANLYSHPPWSNSRHANANIDRVRCIAHAYLNFDSEHISSCGSINDGARNTCEIPLLPLSSKGDSFSPHLSFHTTDLRSKKYVPLLNLPISFSLWWSSFIFERFPCYSQS